MRRSGAATLPRDLLPPRVRRRAKTLSVQAILWFYALVAAGPLILVLVNSFRPTQDLIADPLAVPAPPILDNYQAAWTSASLSTYLINSVIVSVSAVALSLFVSTLVSYALARLRFWGSGILAAFFLSGIMMPFQLAAVPIFHLLSSVGLVNNRFGLILVYAATGVPLSVFVLSSFFRQLPGEVEEAARVDGAGEFRLFRSVMLPMARPAVATVAAITFVFNWNDFFFPLVLIRDPEKFTITVGLTSFFGQYRNDVGPLLAGLILALLPLVLLFSVATKQIITGLTFGGTK